MGFKELLTKPKQGNPDSKIHTAEQVIVKKGVKID